MINEGITQADFEDLYDLLEADESEVDSWAFTWSVDDERWELRYLADPDTLVAYVGSNGWVEA